MCKRVISLLLAASLMLTMMPVTASAEETVPEATVVETIAVEETTEAVAEPAEETTAPSEPETEPTEGTTAPTEETVVVETVENASQEAAKEVLYSGSCGTELTWTLDDAGVLTISGKGAMEDFGSSYDAPWSDHMNSITAIVMEPGITGIPELIFYCLSNVTQVTIPNTVTAIGFRAFGECISLESIVIPDSVTEMGSSCFENCTALRSATLSDQLNTVPERTFWYCKALEEVGLPTSFSAIEAEAFYGCSSLQQIQLPDDLIVIGSGAFGACTGLQQLDIPASVKSIGSSAFYGCSAFESIAIPNGVTELGSSAFAECTGLKSAIIGDGITILPQSVFCDCSNLESVILPGKLTRIEGDTYSSNSGAFYGCGLQKIVLPSTLVHIGLGAFGECNQLKQIVIPDSVTELGEFCFNGCDMLESVTLSKTVTEIPRFAFSSCKALKKITIPSGVTTVKEYAFSGCEGLESVSLPESVKTLEDCAFASCKKLTQITLPSKLDKMLGRTFFNCGLTSLHIPASVTLMTGNPFADCDKLEEVTVASGNTAFCVVDNVLFLKDKSVLIGYPHGREGSSYSIPDGTKGIANCAFMHTTLEDITFPKGLEYIGEQAFWNTSTLTEVVLPAGLRTIGASAFDGCYNLERVVLPDGLTALGVESFFLCSSLAEVNIPSSLTVIPGGCFSGTGLTTLVIPEGITTIERNAFGGYDSKLKTIVLPKSLEDIFYPFGGSSWSLPTLETVYFAGTQEQWEDELYGDSYLKYDKIVFNFSGVLPETGTHGALNWELSGDGILTITGSGSMDSYYSASEYSWYKVRDKVKRVIIGEGITRIGHYAFDGYDKLLNVQLPSTLKSVGDYAFRNCAMLTYASYPGSAEEWDKGVYVSYGNDALHDAIICLGELKDLIDNQAITINGPGGAIAWYKTMPNSDVEYVVNGETLQASSDKNGVFSVPLGSFEEEGTTEVEIRFTKLAGISLGTPITKIAAVEVKPLTLKQTWQFSMDTKLGAEIGPGLKLGVSVVKAEADLASVGITGRVGNSMRISREVSGSDESLEMVSEYLTEPGVKFNSGISGESMSLDADILSASASAAAGSKLIHGLKFDTFDVGNTKHQLALGTFLLGEALTAKPNNVALKPFYHKLQETAFKNTGGTYISGQGVTFGASGDVGALKFKVSDQDIFTAAGVEGSIAISMERTQSGNEKQKATNFTSEFNPSLLSINGLNKGVSGKYLSKDTSISAINSPERQAVQATLLNESTSGLGTFFLDSVHEAEYNNYEFTGEALAYLLEETEHFDSYLNGKRIAVTADDLVELNNVLASSKIPVRYNNVVKQQILQSIPLSFNLQAVIGFSLDLKLSSLSATDYVSKTGFHMEDKTRYNSEATEADAFAQANMVTIQDLFMVASDIMIDKAKDFFNIKKSPVVIGITATWGWIKAKTNSAYDRWVTFVDGSEEDEARAFATSYRVDVSDTAYLAQQNASLSVTDAAPEEFSKAVTLGRPFIVSVTDGEEGAMIADFSDEPLELTIRYAEADLEEAGLTADSNIVRNGGIKMYRYSDGGDYFECVGGENDLEAMTVTAQITRSGQYVLAVDACAPAIRYLDISKGATPTVIAHIDDLTGLDRKEFLFRLDGDIRVDSENIAEHYDAEAGIFTYAVPAELALSHGKHTVSFALKDTSGNEKEYTANFVVDLIAPEVSEVTVSGFTSKGSTVEIRAQVKDDNLASVYAVFSKQLADGTWSNDSAVEMVDLEDGFWGLDYEGDGSCVRIYVKATDIGDNSAVSEMLMAYPALEGIALKQEYLALKPGQTAQLEANVQPGELAEFLRWLPEKETDVITLTEDGEVTAMNEGIAYVIATISDGETELTVRCRIDVAAAEEAEPEKIQLDGVQLGTTKVTAELYKNEFATFEILLQLPQNNVFGEDNSVSQAAAMSQAGNGVAIESAVFTDETMAKYFDLMVLDDRTVQIVPTQDALADAKSVKSSYAGTVTVMVDGEPYETEKLTLTVKKTQPKLKATVAAFNSFYPGQAQPIVITGGTVTGISLTSGKTQPNWLTLADGILTLNENAPAKSVSGKVCLDVDTAEWRIPVAMTLSVKNTYKAPALKFSASIVTLNKVVESKVEVGITANQAEYAIDAHTIRITGEKVTGELAASYENGILTVETTDLTPEKATYKVYFGTPGCKEVALTVKVISAAPTVTYKATGSMDLSFPEQAATVTPTIKNYNGGFTIEEMTAINAKKEAVDFFDEVQEGRKILVSCNSDTPTGSYTLTLKLKLDDESTLKNTVKVTVKRTAVKLKLTSTKVTMNKDLQDKATVAVTCTTKGYDFDLADTVLTYDASKLNVVPEDGNLVVTLKDGAEYGKTYPVSVSADYKGAPAVKLSVAVVKKGTMPKSTIKATGSLDVIREGTAITVKPTYTNVATVNVDKDAILKIYSSADKFKAPIAEVWAENGIFTIDNTVINDHTLKYKAQLETVIGEDTVKSSMISLSVKMGSTKLTVRTSDTTLFAKDKHDRALFWFEAQDETLNDVAKIEFKNTKQEAMFEIIDYGSGVYAIAFRDGNVDSSLVGRSAAKTVTIALNIFIQGNQSEKANTTANVKLTIVK